MIKVEKDFYEVPMVLESKRAFELLDTYINGRISSKEMRNIYASSEVKETLRKLYHGKCAYCEQKIDGTSYIFHYRPKSIYRGLIIEWSNILPTCSACNIAIRGNRNSRKHSFEILGNRFHNKNYINDSHHSYSRINEIKANFHGLLDEKPLLIHPELGEENTYGRIKSPEQQLKYLSNGFIEGIYIDEMNQGADITIEVFDLNRISLVERRKKIIDKYTNQFNQQIIVIRNIISHTSNKNDIAALLETTIYKELEELESRTDSFEEFAGLHRYMWYEFKMFFKSIISPEHFGLLVNFYNAFREQKKPIDVISSISTVPNKVGLTGYLDEINIKNYFSIKSINLKDLKSTKEIYFLGENGDGKTLMLQSILIALKEKFIKSNADKKLVGTILQYLKENESFGARTTIFNENNFSEILGNTYLENVYAYGTNRSLSKSTEIDDLGFLSLFDNDVHLLNPNLWLLRVFANQAKSKLTVEKATNLLEKLLNNDVKIKLDGENLQFTDIRFTERETESLEFAQLSDGYKSVMTWVADLVSRLAKKQPNRDLRDFEGIVLVDEIGLHLHLKWEAKLVNKLRTTFPKIQFLFTTHSPVLILNASDDAIFYRLYKEDGITKISDKFYCRDFAKYRLNTLATSPLFGLDNSLMKSNKDGNLEISDDDYIMRIREQLDKSIKAKAKEGKKYFPPQEIDDMIKELMANQ